MNMSQRLSLIKSDALTQALRTESCNELLLAQQKRDYLVDVEGLNLSSSEALISHILSCPVLTLMIYGAHSCDSATVHKLAFENILTLSDIEYRNVKRQCLTHGLIASLQLKERRKPIYSNLHFREKYSRWISDYLESIACDAELSPEDRVQILFEIASFASYHLVDNDFFELADVNLSKIIAENSYISSMSH